MRKGTGPSGRLPGRLAVTAAGGRSLQRHSSFIVEVGLERTDGRSVHREIVPLLIDVSRLRKPRRPRDAARLAEDVMPSHSARVCGTGRGIMSRATRRPVAEKHHQAVRAAAERETRHLAEASPSAARRLVQVGLFDARESHALAARRRAASLALLDADDRLADLAPDAALRTTARVVAIRFGWDLRP